MWNFIIFTISGTVVIFSTYLNKNNKRRTLLSYDHNCFSGNKNDIARGPRHDIFGLFCISPLKQYCAFVWSELNDLQKYFIDF